MYEVKVLRSLRASVHKEPCPQLHGASIVIDKPAPGVKRGAEFFETGVLLTAAAGEAKVFIPLAELFALAEAADERFSPVPDSTALTA